MTRPSQAQQEQRDDGELMFQFRMALSAIRYPMCDAGGKRLRRGSPSFLPLGDVPDEGGELWALKLLLLRHAKRYLKDDFRHRMLQGLYAQVVAREQECHGTEHRFPRLPPSPLLRVTRHEERLPAPGMDRAAA